MEEEKKAIGFVTLAGAGPGDPGLITRAAVEELTLAEVVVYDRLASSDLLALAAADAELIYVGKAASQHAMTQQRINEVLVEKAQMGKRVCRLKGGDPFLFGRGGEEAEFLAAHDIPFRIIPGVTSAIAVPAYAGIPVTHRGVATSVAIITGHEDPSKSKSDIDWEGIAHGAETLVFLMGLANLPTIASQLIAHGRPASQPAAAIQQGTLATQRVVVSTLENIARRVEEEQLISPVITVIGDVVSLQQQIAWFDNRPLFGRKILVTRAREQASELSRLLKSAGASVVESPMISVAPLPAPADLLTRLQQADWLLFTSANALPNLLQQLATVDEDIRALAAAKIAAIGTATADSLRQFSLRVDYQPSRFIAEVMASEFPAPEGKRLLIIRAETASEELPEILSSRGAVVDILPVYRTTYLRDESLNIADCDVVTFTSASTVKAFVEQYSNETPQHVACIGPVTAEAARAAGLKVDIVAEEATIAAMVTALQQYFADREE